MPIGSFADTNTAEKEPIILSRALLEIEEITFNAEPYEVTNGKGELIFTSDPNINARIVVVDDYADGTFDGKKFYDKFYLKQDPNTGKWGIGENSKLGMLVKAHPKYGPRHFENPRPVNEADFEGFRFESGTEQREDRKGNKIDGTRLSWQSIAPVPKRDKKKAQQAQDQLDQENEVQLSEAEEAEMKAALG